jgi:hypothetical protein
MKGVGFVENAKGADGKDLQSFMLQNKQTNLLLPYLCYASITAGSNIVRSLIYVSL